MLQTSCVRTFVLEIWSWTGSGIPGNLYQISVLTRARLPGLLHSEDLVLAKRRQISAGSWLPQGQIPRTCPAVIANGARHPGSSQPSCSSGHLNSGGQDSWSAQRQGSGRGSRLPQSLGLVSQWPWRDLCVPTGHSPLFPGSHCSPTGPRLGELEGPKQKAKICLPYSLYNSLSTDRLTFAH